MSMQGTPAPDVNLQGGGARRQSHLEFYRQHGIAPVSYDLSSLDAHFERRAALYNKLGLSALAFSGSDVLEVAAGTGHNSLYLAAQRPASLVLLEPNPTAIELIRATYAEYGNRFDAPHVATDKLEDFAPGRQFDIVICENWLGTSPHELGLLDKLSSLVRPGGVLVITTVSPIGFVPNLVRRFLANYIAPPSLPFDERTRIIEAAYTPHLQTLGSMTRNATDWVHDNMMNPAYFGLCLSSPVALARLGATFETLGTYPSFVEDWRWFKQLHGEARKINAHFLDQYWRKCHNFLDARSEPENGDAGRNRALEDAAADILKAVEASEDALLHNGDDASAISSVVACVEAFLRRLPAGCDAAAAAIEEVLPLLGAAATVTADDVATLKSFNALFGRETSYLSLERARAPL